MTLLSILDQSPIRAGGTAADAIAETLELARIADRLGYHRYWLAEHHSAEGLAGTAPEILVARIAALTSGLRVGSGGVMLSHYSPLKVAETFRVLETLYPGRIDLGIGRAPGSDQLTMRALQNGPGALGLEHFPHQIKDLIAYLSDGFEPGRPFADVHAMPVGESMPEVWLLGSSDQSAAYAAQFGCAFSFAHFITSRGGPEIMRAYFEYFRPSTSAGAPRGSIGVFVLCADTEAEAQRLAASRDLWRLRLLKGRIEPVSPPDEALAYPYSDEERAVIERFRLLQVIGAPEQVRAELMSLGEAYGVDEFVVVTICYDFAARARSYELLAQAFALEPR